MDTQKLRDTALYLTKTPGKGILAADESAGTCEKRFSAVQVECTAENRRAYREILVAAPGNEQYLSGIIFFEETLGQTDKQGKLLKDVAVEKGILPGVKLDGGLVALPGYEGEKISKGLDTLKERVEAFAAQGVRFAKWRSVITIGEGMPSEMGIGANAYVLAYYARVCQDAGVVPIVEPEVLFDGTHSIDVCNEVMRKTYDQLLAFLKEFRVYMPGCILKTSMILPGKESGIPLNWDEVGTYTSNALRDKLPEDFGGVVFLSGGQTSKDAFMNLNSIAGKGPYPWGVTFSYSRAIQDPVLKTWAQDIANLTEAESVFVKQLEVVSKATKGELSEDDLGHLDNFVTKSQDL